jgi:hypothetical protein
MEMPDRLGRHAIFSLALRIAKMVSLSTCLWFIIVLNPGVFRLSPIFSEELSVTFRLVVSTLMVLSAVWSIVSLLQNGRMLDDIRHKIDQHFTGTTWITHSAATPQKGFFVGLSDLLTMRIALDNGAIAEVRIDHAVPVGHSVSIPGQLWSMDMKVAKAEVAKRQRRSAHVRVLSILMASLGGISVVAACFVAKWAVGPLAVFTMSNCFLALVAWTEAEDHFAEDCAFLERRQALMANATSETAIRNVTIDHSLPTEIEGRLDAKTRTAVRAFMMITFFVGVFMTFGLGLIPTMRAFGDSSMPSPDLFGIAWGVGGGMLAVGSICLSEWYDRMALLPKSYFERYKWIAPGEVIGRVQDSILGGSVLKLRFPDGTVENYPIRYLRQGDVVSH